MELELLMSPHFAEFSAKIVELAKTRKEKEHAFKELYLKHKQELTDIDNEVKTLKEEFEASVKK